ncbi:MAG: hypothetical protein Kow0074_26010 [Candidatus Zixiibacteriota bacterium]
MWISCIQTMWEYAARWMVEVLGEDYGLHWFSPPVSHYGAENPRSHLQNELYFGSTATVA